MIGGLMKEGKREEAEEAKKQVTANAETVEKLSAEEKEVEEKIKTIMMTIPNIIDPSVPIGKDDSENVEVQKIWRAGCAGLRNSISCRYYGKL